MTPTGTIRDVPTVWVGSVSDVATGLSVPWGIAFLPGGRAVVTLRNEARLVLVGADGTVTDVVGPGADEIHASTRPAGEGGLLGVAVLPGASAASADLALYQTTADDNRIVRATLSMAHSLNCEVVAEGVETEQHFEFLRNEGCDVLQGFLFCRPLSVASFDNLLKERARLLGAAGARRA